MSTMNITPIELDQIQKQHCKGYFKDFPPEVVFKLSYLSLLKLKKVIQKLS